MILLLTSISSLSFLFPSSFFEHQRNVEPGRQSSLLSWRSVNACENLLWCQANLGGCVRERLASEILYHWYHNRPDLPAVTAWDSRFDFQRMRIPNDSAWHSTVASQREGSRFETHEGQGLFCVEFASSHLLIYKNSNLKRTSSYSVSAIPLNGLTDVAPQVSEWQNRIRGHTLSYFFHFLPTPLQIKRGAKIEEGGGGRMAMWGWGVGRGASGTNSYYKWASRWIPQQFPLIGCPETVVFVSKRVR